MNEKFLIISKIFSDDDHNRVDQVLLMKQQLRSAW